MREQVTMHRRKEQATPHARLLATLQHIPELPLTLSGALGRAKKGIPPVSRMEQRPKHEQTTEVEELLHTISDERLRNALHEALNGEVHETRDVADDPVLQAWESVLQHLAAAKNGEKDALQELAQEIFLFECEWKALKEAERARMRTQLLEHVRL